ncbi:MAG: aminotransferase class I/II-fold pyridoxal phosphate-dependent enzyme [Candidatus Schekmanbacteria bacterium]|nr:aminotransferase class I/II-fold pyridoxal phosphate-dependent enzyme [Candidatus Schekmanbacteria bacterium]
MSVNPNVHGLPLSPTIAINDLSDALRQRGQRIFKLGLGQSPFPVPTTVVEALRANAHQKAYLPVLGLPALREAVADYHRRNHAVACSPEDVIVGPGSKELMFLLQVVYRGDLVVPVPAWVSYAPQARIVGRTVRPLATRLDSAWRVAPEALEDLCRDTFGHPRILVLNYPNNPTGTTYSPAELAALGAVARRCGVIILSDEIYGELHHTGAHSSIATLYPEGTILSSGLSKWCGAGGWRLGTFVFPSALRWLLDAMGAVASETYTTTSAPIQYAAVEAFRGGIRIERYLWRARRILAALGREIAARLRAAGLRLADPAGGFYLFPDFAPHRAALARRGIGTSLALTTRLLEETGVAVLPGSAFGQSEAELTVRIAYVDFDGARAMAALERKPPDYEIEPSFLADCCGDVLEATDRICGWLADLYQSGSARD